jgi:hypothetical protein
VPTYCIGACFKIDHTRALVMPPNDIASSNLALIYRQDIVPNDGASCFSSDYIFAHQFEFRVALRPPDLKSMFACPTTEVLPCRDLPSTREHIGGINKLDVLCAVQECTVCESVTYK